MSYPLKNTLKSMDEALEGNPHYQPLQRIETQRDKGHTKHSKNTTILFPTLFFVCIFLETTQFETQEKNMLLVARASFP